MSIMFFFAVAEAKNQKLQLCHRLIKFGHDGPCTESYIRGWTHADAIRAVAKANEVSKVTCMA